MTNDLQPSGSLQFFWSLSCPLEEYWVSSVEPLLGKLTLFKTEEKVFSAFFFKVPFLVVGLILGVEPYFLQVHISYKDSNFTKKTAGHLNFRQLNFR